MQGVIKAKLLQPKGVKEKNGKNKKECIRKNILREFLVSQKADAIKVTIYEFDAVQHDKTLREEGLREGDIKRIIAQITSKIKKNLDIATIAEHLEETEETIRPIYDAIKDNPDKSADEIYELL